MSTELLKQKIDKFFNENSSKDILKIIKDKFGGKALEDYKPKKC